LPRREGPVGLVELPDNRSRVWLHCQPGARGAHSDGECRRDRRFSRGVAGCRL